MSGGFPSMNRAAAADTNPHWQEIGRTTLGATGDISVTGLETKPYIMVLEHCIAAGASMGTKLRFDNDSGSNYAWRRSSNGGADITATSATALQYDGIGDANDSFMVWHINNTNAQEKLTIGQVAKRNSTGATNPPDRFEVTGKWITTSQFTRVDEIDNDSNQYASGSEVVVLGYDPADTSATNFWQQLASTTLGGAADTISSGAFTSKKYLYYELHAINSGQVEPNIRVGTGGSIDSGSNYARRSSYNGAADGTSTSNSWFGQCWNSAATSNFISGFILNVNGREKLGIAEGITQNTAGATNCPTRAEEVSKWTNTSQINIIDAVNTDTGDFAAGSSLIIWGSDQIWHGLNQVVQVLAL